MTSDEIAWCLNNARALSRMSLMLMETQPKYPPLPEKSVIKKS